MTWLVVIAWVSVCVGVLVAVSAIYHASTYDPGVMTLGWAAYLFFVVVPMLIIFWAPILLVRKFIESYS